MKLTSVINPRLASRDWPTCALGAMLVPLAALGCYRFECDVIGGERCQSVLQLKLDLKDAPKPSILADSATVSLNFSAYTFLERERFIRLGIQEMKDGVEGLGFFQELKPQGPRGDWQERITLSDDRPCPQLRLRVHAGAIPEQPNLSFLQSAPVDKPIVLPSVRLGKRQAAPDLFPTIGLLGVDPRLPVAMRTVYADSSPNSPSKQLLNGLLGNDGLGMLSAATLSAEGDFAGIGQASGDWLRFERSAEMDPACANIRARLSVHSSTGASSQFFALPEWCYPLQGIAFAATPDAIPEPLVAVANQKPGDSATQLRVARVQTWPNSTRPGDLLELWPKVGSAMIADPTLLAVGRLPGPTDSDPRVVLAFLGTGEVRLLRASKSQGAQAIDTMIQDTGLEAALRQALIAADQNPKAATFGTHGDQSFLVLGKEKQLALYRLGRSTNSAVFGRCPLEPRSPDDIVEQLPSDITALAWVPAREQEAGPLLLVATGAQLSVYQLSN